MKAERVSVCPRCFCTIKPGDEIRSTGEDWAHVTCPDALGFRPGERVCPICHLTSCDHGKEE